jgi:hypothetical protein
VTYAEAQFPAVERIAGCRLLPLCLGHALVLQRIESPFVATEEERGKVPGTGDMAYLMWIASRPYLKAWTALGTLRARLQRQWIAHRLRVRGADEVARLHDWLRRQWSGPRTKQKRDGERLGAPALAALKITLMAELGMSEDQALSHPIALVRWDAAIACERHGGIEILQEVAEALKAAMVAMAERDGYQIITGGDWRRMTGTAQPEAGA